MKQLTLMVNNDAKIELNTNFIYFLMWRAGNVKIMWDIVKFCNAMRKALEINKEKVNR